MPCPEDQFWGRSPTFSANDVETFLSPPHPAHCFATRREGLAFRDVYQSAGSGSFCALTTSRMNCTVHIVEMESLWPLLQEQARLARSWYLLCVPVLISGSCCVE